MLGSGGASKDMRKTMEVVEADYIALKEKAQESGINGFVFTSQLPVHKDVSAVKTEDEQVKALVDMVHIVICSAGIVYNSLRSAAAV